MPIIGFTFALSKYFIAPIMLLMFSRIASSAKARLAAAALTAGSPVAGAFDAAAQQMANAPNFAACDTIKDPAQAAQCSADALRRNLDERQTAALKKIDAANTGIAKADQRIATADAAVECAKFLGAKKAQGVKLDPARLNRAEGCRYAAELGMK